MNVKSITPMTTLGPKDRGVNVEMVSGRIWRFRIAKDGKVRLEPNGPNRDSFVIEHRMARKAAIEALLGTP